MCCAFSGLGHSLRLYCTSNESAVDYDKIREFYDLKNSFDICTTKRFEIKLFGSLLYSFITSIKVYFLKPVEIVYSRNIISLLFLLFIRSKLYYEAHNSPTYFRKKIENLVFRFGNFDKLIVISNELKFFYLKHYSFLQEDKIVVAHDAASECVAPVENLVDLKNEETPCLGYTGSLFPGKGIEMIVRIAKICPLYDFHVVGGGQKDIERIRLRLKPSANITFHGFVDHSILHAYRSQFDIALLPPNGKVFSSHEGVGDIAKYMSPLKLFEYMAAKLPIICSDLPVLREIIEHNRNGILIPTQDEKLWASAIDELISKPNFTSSISANAYQDFIQKYTWEIRVQALSTHFQNV
jgi:glycosyltransferase involved in cell wall biosynthesis